MANIKVAKLRRAKKRPNLIYVIFSRARRYDPFPYRDPDNEFLRRGSAIYSSWRLLLVRHLPAVAGLLGVGMFEPESFRFFERIVKRRRRDKLAEGHVGKDVLGILVKATEGCGVWLIRFLKMFTILSDFAPRAGS